MAQTQTDFELDSDILDEMVEDSGRAWMAWVITPLALVAVAGIAFFVIRRFFGNSDN